jgi:hypothetical protein
MPDIAAPQAELPLAPRRFVIPDDQNEAPAVPAAAEDGAPVQNNGDQAPPATPEAKPEEQQLTPEQAAERDRKKEGQRFGRKLDKAYRQRAEAQAHASQLEKRLAELEKAQAPKPLEGEPRLEQFDYDPEKYATAKAEFAKTQATKELQTKQQQETGNANRNRLVASWEEKVAALEDTGDEFDPRIAQIAPNTPLTVAIMEAENGAQIANWLLNNPKEDARIGALHPWSQVREIGKLEARLLLEPVKPKTPSKAPAPITPLTGAASTATDEPSDQDDYPTWLRKRRKQVHRR